MGQGLRRMIGSIIMNWRQPPPLPRPPSKPESLLNSCSSSKAPAPQQYWRATLFECKICFETASLRDSFNPTGCDHVYCNPCTGKYVTSKLSDNTYRISCPQPGCGGLLDPARCRGIIPRKLLDKWGASLVHSAIDDSHKLYCPYADCSVLMIHDDDEDRGRKTDDQFRCRCPYCERAVCVKCRSIWHPQMDCRTYQRLKGRMEREEKMVVELAESEKWKRCPNCKMYVSKSEGCCHITCRCGGEFCYNCGDLYSKDHRCGCGR